MIWPGPCKVKITDQDWSDSKWSYSMPDASKSLKLWSSRISQQVWEESVCVHTHVHTHTQQGPPGGSATSFFAFPMSTPRGSSSSQDTLLFSHKGPGKTLRASRHDESLPLSYCSTQGRKAKEGKMWASVENWTMHCCAYALLGLLSPVFHCPWALRIEDKERKAKPSLSVDRKMLSGVSCIHCPLPPETD